MTTARASHEIARLLNGEVLVAGGYSGPGSLLASAELYDPFHNTWRAAAPMTRARDDYRLTLLSDGRALATGGIAPGATNTTELYDPILDLWTVAAPMSSVRSQHTATLLTSGEVLVCGGFDTRAPLASCERYDPRTDAWHAAAPMQWAGGNKIATMLPSGDVLMIGNGDEHVEIYDPVADAWTEAAPMPAVRFDYTAALLPSGRLLVLGGYIGPAISNTATIYDPETDSWTPTATMAARRTRATATVLENGDIFVAGANTTQPDAEIFDAVEESWRSAGDMFQDRTGALAALVDPGDVLIVGGLMSAAGPLASNERYVVAGEPTSVELTAAPEPSQVGQPYAATVTISVEAGTPTGTIVVSDPFGASCGPVALVDGAATCELVAPSDGPHDLTAVYTSDNPYFESSSGMAPHDVVEADTHLSIVSHAPEPSLPGQPITVTVDFGVAPPGGGTPIGAVFVDDGTDSCLIDQGETSCALMPPPDRGPVAITARYDGDGNYNPSSDTVTHHVNELPVAAADTYETLEDAPLAVAAAVGVLANDFDPDGYPLVVTTVGGLVVDGGTVEMAADGSFTFEPLPDANGTATFQYAISDGLEESIAAVTITVASVNDPPEFALAANPSLPAGSIGVHSIAGFAQVLNFGPPDEDDQAVLAWPMRTVSDPDNVLAALPSIAPDGTLQFALTGHGGVAMLAVALQDDGGTANGGRDTSDEETFTIDVAPGADLSASIDDGTVFAVGGEPLSYTIVVRNTGPDAADGARVQETVSANLVDIAWTCSATAGASCSPSGVGAIDDQVDLPPGGAATYEMTAIVVATPEATVENAVRVFAPGSVTDFNPANDEASDWDATGVFADGFDGPPAR